MKKRKAVLIVELIKAGWEEEAETMADEIIERKWTRDKVDALEERADFHISDCEECESNCSVGQSLLEGWSNENIDRDTLYDKYYSHEETCKDCGNCPIGESLQEHYLDACCTLSWQDNFTAGTITGSPKK